MKATVDDFCQLWLSVDEARTCWCVIDDVNTEVIDDAEGSHQQASVHEIRQASNKVINNLQNGIILLIDIPFEGNVFLSTRCEFYYDDVIVLTSLALS